MTRRRRGLVILGQSQVILRVLGQSVGNVLLHGSGKPQELDVLLGSDVPQDDSPAPVLHGGVLPLRDPEGHLRLGGRAADHGVKGFCDLVQALERHPEAGPVLEVGQRAGDPVKVEAHRGGHVLFEGPGVDLVVAVVPQVPAVREAPTVFVLAQHVDEPVDVEPGLFGAYSEHQAEIKAPKFELKAKIIVPRSTSTPRPT